MVLTRIFFFHVPRILFLIRTSEMFKNLFNKWLIDLFLKLILCLQFGFNRNLSQNWLHLFSTFKYYTFVNDKSYGFQKFKLWSDSMVLNWNLIGFKNIFKNSFQIETLANIFYVNLFYVKFQNKKRKDSDIFQAQIQFQVWHFWNN